MCSKQSVDRLFALQTVLDTLVQSAARLCRADRSGIRLAKDSLYYNVASHGYSPEHKARMERETFKVDRSSVVGSVVLDAKSVHLIEFLSSGWTNVGMTT